MSDTKGMRLSPETRRLYDEMKAVAGGTDDTFIDQLLQISKLHDLKMTQPEFAEELKELQKHLTRLSSVFVRLRERGADALEEVKERTSEEVGRLEQELSNYRTEYSNMQKHLTQKEEELAAAHQASLDLRTKVLQLEKAAKTLEELNQLTKDKLVLRDARIAELEHAERDAAAMAEQLQNLTQSFEQERSVLKAAEKELRQQIEVNQKEFDRKLMEADAAAARTQQEHKRALEALTKEKDMEAREAVLQKQSEWQEKLAETKNELNEQYAIKLAELVERLQGKK